MMQIPRSDQKALHNSNGIGQKLIWKIDHHLLRKKGSLIGEGALCCESAPASVLPCPAGPEDELGAVGSLGHRMGVSEVHSGTGGQKGTSAYLGEKPQVVWASTPELNTASTACGATWDQHGLTKRQRIVTGCRTRQVRVGIENWGNESSKQLRYGDPKILLIIKLFMGYKRTTREVMARPRLEGLLQRVNMDLCVKKVPGIFTTQTNVNPRSKGNRS